MLYASTDYLNVMYDDSCHAAHMQWLDFAQGDEFRGGLDTGLELIKDKGLVNWLADLRKMAAISPEDEAWSNQNWFPRALAAGIKNMAIIPSEDVFNQMSVDTIMNSVPGTALTVHYFSTVEDAQAWLKAQLFSNS